MSLWLCPACGEVNVGDGLCHQCGDVSLFWNDVDGGENGWNIQEALRMYVEGRCSAAAMDAVMKREREVLESGGRNLGRRTINAALSAYSGASFQPTRRGAVTGPA